MGPLKETHSVKWVESFDHFLYSAHDSSSHNQFSADVCVKTFFYSMKLNYGSFAGGYGAVFSLGLIEFILAHWDTVSMASPFLSC